MRGRLSRSGDMSGVQRGVKRRKGTSTKSSGIGPVVLSEEGAGRSAKLFMFQMRLIASSMKLSSLAWKLATLCAVFGTVCRMISGVC